MGLFSAIGSVGGAVFGGPVGSVLGGGIGGFLDSSSSASSAESHAEQNTREQMNFAQEQSQVNRDFQERMRGTQYQTATADMKAAGLNPMLAYQQGGAGTPSGSTGSAGAAPAGVRNPMTDVASAGAIADIEKTNADRRVSDQQAALVAANIPKAEAETRLAVTSADAQRYQIENMYPWVAKQTEADTAKHFLESDKANAERNAWMGDWKEYSDAFKAGFLGDVKSRAAGGAVAQGSIKAQIAKAVAESRLTELGIPEAEAMSRKWKSGMGQDVLPWVRELGGVLNSGAAASRMLRPWTR